MAKLLFYRQKRYDGAVRTGIELDDETIAEHFDDVEGERDPSLLWFVDLRCEGDAIPDDPDDAVRWLLDETSVIRDGFARFSEKLRAGADTDIYSLQWADFRGKPADVRMEIACSAVRRVDAREMSRHLQALGDSWDELIRSLLVPQHADDTQ